VKPAPFDYIRATSELEAVSALDRHRGSARILAGGQSLMPLLNLRRERPGILIDINEIPTLAAVATRHGVMRMGTMTRQAVALASPEIRSEYPLLAEAVRRTGNRATRNRGTMGGSVAYADPCGEIPAALLALDSVVVARSLDRGERLIDARTFFAGAFRTSLYDDELVMGVRFSTPQRAYGWGFEEISRQGGRAIVGLAALLALDEERNVADIRMAFFGVGETPIRITSLEDEMIGHTTRNDTLQELSQAFVDRLDPSSDRENSRSYRQRVARYLAQRALGSALDRARALL
jgi:carbon-monoxide dehydrogenase medium subunit